MVRQVQKLGSHLAVPKDANGAGASGALTGCWDALEPSRRWGSKVKGGGAIGERPS